MEGSGKSGYVVRKSWIWGEQRGNGDLFQAQMLPGKKKLLRMANEEQKLFLIFFFVVVGFFLISPSICDPEGEQEGWCLPNPVSAAFPPAPIPIPASWG